MANRLLQDILEFHKNRTLLGIILVVLGVLGLLLPILPGLLIILLGLSLLAPEKFGALLDTLRGKSKESAEESS